MTCESGKGVGFFVADGVGLRVRRAQLDPCPRLDFLSTIPFDYVDLLPARACVGAVHANFGPFPESNMPVHHGRSAQVYGGGVGIDAFRLKAQLRAAGWLWYHLAKVRPTPLDRHEC